MITVELEGRPQARIEARSLEEERKLRLWLARSRDVRGLPTLLARLLEELDGLDREGA